MIKDAVSGYVKRRKRKTMLASAFGITRGRSEADKNLTDTKIITCISIGNENKIRCAYILKTPLFSPPIVFSAF